MSIGQPRLRKKRAAVTYTPLSLLEKGLELFLLLTGTMTFAVEVYEIPADPASVLLACLGISLVLPAIYGRWRWKFPPALVLLGVMMVAVGLWMEPLARGGRTVLAAAVGTVAQAVGRDITLLVLQEGSPLECLAFVLLVAALLGILLGAAVLGSRFWTVFLLPMPLLLPAFIAELDLAWLPLLAVGCGWGMRLFESLALRGSPAKGTLVGMLALPAVALTLTGLFFLIPQAQYTQPTWALQAQNRLINWGVELVDRLWQRDPAQTDLPQLPWTLPGSGDTGVVNLAGAGPRNYTGRSVLQVEGEAPGTLYLRGSAVATYTGSAWLPLDEGQLEQLSRAFSATQGENRSIYFPAALYPTQRDYTVTITNLGLAGNLIYYPYQPLNLSFAQMSGDMGLVYQGEADRYTVSYRPLDTGQPMGVLTGENQWTQWSYREFVYDTYLQVPQELRAGLQAFLTRARRAVDTYPLLTGPGNGAYSRTMGAASEVAALLDATTQYDLQTPVTPQGEDFVLYFLNTSHRGYCMHYASAATLLLRLQGIPARYVSGYLTQLPDTLQVTVPDSSAHAWVEIYLDGYGWYPVEMTPAGAVLPNEGETVETLPQDPESQEDPEIQESQPEITPPAEQAPEAPQGGMPAPARWILPLALAVILVSLPLLYGLWRLVRWQRLVGERDNNRAVIGIYGLFQELLPWGGETPPQVEDLTRKARFSAHTLTAQERDLVFAQLLAQRDRVSQRLPRWKRWIFCHLVFPGK